MYAIYVDGNLLYAPNLTHEGYMVTNLKMSKELNKAGSLSFTIFPENVMYEAIRKLKSIITVYQDSEEIFRGRVLHDEKNFYNQKNIYCEGELSFLLDTIQRPYSMSGTVEQRFRNLIQNHNAQVEEEKQFTVGNITVSGSGTWEQTEYKKTMDAVEELIAEYGGYINTRLSDRKRYIDYTADSGGISAQVIEFGVNLLDISEYINAEEVFTVLIPVGKDGLTISSVNDGKDYIEDTSAINIFGKVWITQSWDLETPEEILEAGKKYLESSIAAAVTLSIKAVDLHLIDVNTEQIHLGKYVRVVSIPHKINQYFLCSKIDLDLMNPDKTEYTLGVKLRSMTEQQLSNEKSVQNVITAAQTSAKIAAMSAQKANEAVEGVIVNIPTEYVKTAVFEAYKKELEQKIATVYRFKGSVDAYEELPETSTVGNVYNVRENGMNYAWTEDGWDSLGGMIDLSGYVKTEDLPVTAEQYQDILSRLDALEGGAAE